MRRLAVAALVLAPALAAAGPPKAKKPKPVEPPPDAQIAVRAALLEYQKALAARDPARALAFYAEDARVWGNRKLHGKEAIRAWLVDFTTARSIDMVHRDVVVRTESAALATALGHWDSTVTWEEQGKLQSTSARDGSFLYVLVRQGGAWRIQSALVARKGGIGAAPPPPDGGAQPPSKTSLTP